MIHALLRRRIQRLYTLYDRSDVFRFLRGVGLTRIARSKSRGAVHSYQFGRKGRMTGMYQYTYTQLRLMTVILDFHKRIRASKRNGAFLLQQAH